MILLKSNRIASGWGWGGMGYRITVATSEERMSMSYEC